jgi:hypothetical protein
MVLTKLSYQHSQIIGMLSEILAPKMQIVMEEIKSAPNYYGKERTIKVRHMVLAQLATIGIMIHAKIPKL